MLIERPPLLYRLLFPGAVWRLPVPDKKAVYLTFDDGPVPEVTPRVLDILERHNVKATFFVVGDNVRRNPGLLEEILAHGHSIGNHTMHHIQGIKTSRKAYLADIAQAALLIPSTLYRPPHGLIKLSQLVSVRKNFTIVMHDVVTRDYNSRFDSRRVLENVRRYVRNGSIIVFHDSIKARDNMLGALEDSIVWLKQEGYELLPVPQPSDN